MKNLLAVMRYGRQLDLCRDAPLKRCRARRRKLDRDQLPQAGGL